MSEASTIVVSEQTTRSEYVRLATSGTTGVLVVVRPDAEGRRLELGDALERLGKIRRRGARFDAAVLSCDRQSDWASGYARARIARVLLALLEPGWGQLTIQAPFAAPGLEAQILGLAAALAEVAAPDDLIVATRFGVPRTERPGLASARARAERPGLASARVRVDRAYAASVV